MSRIITVALFTVAAVSPLACDGQDPTGIEVPATSEAHHALTARDGAGDSVVAISGGTASLLGTLPLPVNQNLTSTVPALYIAQKGTGGTADFRIENASNGNIALSGRTIGPGTAVGGTTPAGTSGTAISGTAYGTGTAGSFQIVNPNSTNPAVLGQTNGFGFGVRGRAVGENGYAGYFENVNVANSFPTIVASNEGFGHAGHFQTTKPTAYRATLQTESRGTGEAFKAISRNTGQAGYFESQSTTNSNTTLAVKTNGTGWAGVFVAANYGKGVFISTKPGQPGLQVWGGTKNAVVSTPSGAKALYTEESTEVWFTDYGFGRLTNGTGRILFDPSFAQTINPDESYHVFVQPYGRAELYVAERTPLGFTVVLKDGDPNAEFSYRIVAKRLGFEGKRLEAAPWADNLSSRY
ncbi:MAG TPA: hypothetical protein VKA25_09530 [Gemmatimonadales bacterium]|nr:hypothetical protein [Gemmatimonadales bacterium]